MLKFFVVVLLLGVSAVHALSLNKLESQDTVHQTSKGCSDADPCTNGGICDNGKCECLNGTTGDKCEIIEACRYSWLLWKECGYKAFVKCLYNQTSQTHYCGCELDDKEAYDTELRQCREKCRHDSDCKNGAKCEDSLCRCLPGTKEDQCQVIEKCVTRSDVDELCGFALPTCLYNQTSHLPYCSCILPEKYGYNKDTKECLECNCGYNSNGCKFEHGKKSCHCSWGYAQTDKGTCEVAPCDCGPNGSCHFEGWKTICDCHEGYVEVNGKCEDSSSGVTDDSSSETSVHPKSKVDSSSGVTDDSSSETSVHPKSKVDPGATDDGNITPPTQQSTNNKSFRTGTIVLGIFLALCIIGLVGVVLKLRSRG